MTILLERQTISAIQAIWDQDHGTRNDGWFLRVRYEDGTVEDDTNCPICDLSRDASMARIVETVAAWLFDLDGMAADQAQAVRDMIEVRR